MKTQASFPDTFEFLNQVFGKYKLCLTTYGNAIEKAACIERFGGRKYFEFVFDEHNINFIEIQQNFIGSFKSFQTLINLRKL